MSNDLCAGDKEWSSVWLDLINVHADFSDTTQLAPVLLLVKMSFVKSLKVLHNIARGKRKRDDDEIPGGREGKYSKLESPKKSSAGQPTAAVMIFCSLPGQVDTVFM